MTEVERLEKLIAKGGPKLADDIVKTLGIPAFEREQVLEILKECEEEGANARDKAYELLDFFTIEDDIMDDDDDFDEDIDEDDFDDAAEEDDNA